MALTPPQAATVSAPGWDCHVHVFDAARPVAPGHYQPAHRPLEEIEPLARAQGAEHLVLVQPSVYGSDNALLLQALARTPGRHRGVVVLEADVSGAELARMQALGVRGVRFNLVSPVGNGRGGAAELAALVPRLRALGWHVQWYAQATDLPAVLAWQRRSGLVCVLDHLAGLRADLAAEHPAWACLAELLAEGAWVKLSGWYRLGAQAPYAALRPVIERVAALAERAVGHGGEAPRLVWGSDWPHTAFAPEAMPAYGSVWQPVPQALGEAAAQAILTAGRRLYG